MKGRLVSQSTPTLRHSTNKPPRSDAPTTVQTGNRSTPVCHTSERPATQSARNNASVGAPGCRTPRLQLNVQFTTCYRCYAMPSSSKKPLMRACLLLAFTEAWQHTALSTLSQTSPANCCVFIFQNPLTNRHQLLQPLKSSLHCPHSLCNAVDRQHLPRKPRHGTSCNHSRHKITRKQQ